MDLSIYKQKIRSILHYKNQTILSLAGLTIAVTVFFVISHIAAFELSFDKFHENFKDIYRVQNIRTYKNLVDESAGCPPMTGPILKDEIPEIIESARVKPLLANSILEITSKGQKSHYYHDHLFYADNSVFKIFSLRFLSGNPDNALNNINTAVVTKDFGQKYFGRKNVLGERFKCSTSEGVSEYTITAVMENTPPNSYLTFDCLLSFKSLISLEEQTSYTWGWNAFNTFVRLKPNSNMDAVNKKLEGVVAKYKLSEAEMIRVFKLQPIETIHLHSNLRHEIGRRGNAFMLYLLLSIAAFILFVAWINFINVSTAKSKKQILEINVKNVLGCTRNQIVNGQLFETFILNSVAVFIAVILLKAFSPLFNNLYHVEIRPLDLKSWTIVIGLSFIISMLSGLYTAFTQFSYNRLLADKSLIDSKKSLIPRNSLVVFQFAVSIVFIIATILVIKQIRFMELKQDEMAMDNIITVKTLTSNKILQTSQIAFIHEAAKKPGIQKISVSTSIPGGNYSNVAGAIRPINAKTEDGIKCSFIDVNENFFDLFRIKLLAGNYYTSKGLHKDEIVINAKAARMFGYDKPSDAINQKVIMGELDNRIATISGVVEDYHQKSLLEPINPSIFKYQEFGDYISVRCQAGSVGVIINRLKGTWDKFFPDQPFEYSFNDKFYSAQYDSYRIFGKLVSTFAILIIIISCTGLFALARYSINNRIKEIGVRKVNGAKMKELIIMLSSDFMKWVIIALIIACPVAWYVMNKWLINFAYRTTFSWWIFGLAGFLTILIAMTTVYMQTWKAANRNPVEALRYE